MELSLSNRQIRGGGAHNAGGLTKQASLVTLVQLHPLRSQSLVTLVQSHHYSVLLLRNFNCGF